MKTKPRLVSCRSFSEGGGRPFDGSSEMTGKSRMFKCEIFLPFPIVSDRPFTNVGKESR